MKLKRDGIRRAASCLVLASAALLQVACGGGGEQVEVFTPNRVIAFGDESSVITAEGNKYSVNALTVDTATLDCASNPVWVQYVADTYNLVFPECNPNDLNEPSSRMRAVAGARVVDIAGQIDTQLTDDAFDGKDLVTIMAGANDILDEYQRFLAGASEGEVLDAAENAGADLAEQVNRVADLGAKVLIATVIDMGLTPFALQEEAINAGRAELLTGMTRRFNAALRGAIQNDGRRIGLVLIDERVQLIARVTTSLGYVNVTNAACAVALPDCTTDTLVDDPESTTTPPAKASGSTWLWADGTHLSAGGQNSFGALAAERARNNPF